ncbi:MAG: hypothetical protein ABI855_17155 [Bacteroidota bacterium]
MTKFFYITTIAATALSCDQPVMLSNSRKEPLTTAIIKEADLKQQEHSIYPGNLLILSDAEKIMGEPLHLSDSATKYAEEALTYLCAYKANKEDMKSKKTGAIYFLFEDYDRVASAQKKYSFIKRSTRITV